jgi:2-polyprenyl-6-methoxyphenol hydroxylase-like FAD-dependent oxidoreductase
MKIVCVGGGPAGLYFAILMARAGGHEITVLERNPAGITYGWGVVFWDDLLVQLQTSDPETAHEVSANAFRWNGQLLAVDGRQPVHEAGRGYGLGRTRLLEILAERAVALGVQIRFEYEVVDDLHEFADADLIVACDGVNSRLRRRHRDRSQTSISAGRNKYIWLGTSKVFDAFTFAFVHTDAGWIWCHAYGFDDETSTFIVECSPETWTGLRFDTLGEEQTLRLLEELFEPDLEGHPLCSNGAVRWLNFRTVTNEHWHHGNIALMGDAAHTTHFTIGSGTKLAVEDALALAAKLREGAALESALAAYGRERRLALLAAQTDARFSAQWFENVGRYAGLEAERFFALLRERRSPLLPWIPPGAYYRLHQATHNVAALRRLRRWAAPRIKALH